MASDLSFSFLMKQNCQVFDGFFQIRIKMFRTKITEVIPFQLDQIDTNWNQLISQVKCLFFFYEPFMLISGDLFIDGKAIPRPQFRHNVTQQNNRRSRHDRHWETVQVDLGADLEIELESSIDWSNASTTLHTWSK